MTQPKTPEATRIEMNQLVLPPHTNAHGTAFGGTIMSWIDICAGMSAQRHSRCVVVTASMDQLDFKASITLGQLVTLRSAVNFVGRTSMEIGVRVDAEDTLSGKTIHAASAYLTFVALDEAGNPTPVPRLQPTTDAEKLRFEEAKARRAQRLALAKQRHQLAEAHRLALATSDPDTP